MKLVLEPGDTLVIEVAGGDGTFTLTYGEDELSIVSSEPDSDGRGDIIYSERFGAAAHRLLDEPNELDDLDEEA